MGIVEEPCKCFQLVNTLLFYGINMSLKNKNGKSVNHFSELWKDRGNCTYFAKTSLLKLKSSEHDWSKFSEQDEKDSRLEYKKELKKLANEQIAVYPKVCLYELIFFEINKIAKYSTNGKKKLWYLYFVCKLWLIKFKTKPKVLLFEIVGDEFYYFFSNDSVCHP